MDVTRLLAAPQRADRDTDGDQPWKSSLSPEEKTRLSGILLQNLRQHAPELRQVMEKVNSEWCYEDGLYRYYHQSSKVFNLQNSTREIVGALGAVAPEERSFGHPFFNDLLREGTGRAFSLEDNDDWQERVGPIVHAFFHARFFLEMAVKYAQVLEMPDRLPSGWAALLYLYGLR